MAEKIIYTMDYFSLVDLFIKSGLEIHPDDPVPEGLLTCFKKIDEETGERLGAAGIVLNHKNEYILRCVAVEEEHRGKGYGIQLVNKVLDEGKMRGATRIWLTGKVPEFYKKFGFTVAKRSDAPFKTKCGECPQYHNGCESEVMVYYY